MRRTGSNHLFNVLRNFDELSSCGEIFNFDRVSGVEALLPHIRDITGLSCQVEEDPLLRAYARGNPGAFVRIVEEAAARERKRAYCFKIFEDQLDRKTIEQAILARPRTHLVLLSRRALDAYVSLQKAMLTQRWISLDTTDVSVKLDAEAFGDWLARQRAWYRHWLDWAKTAGQRPAILTYEMDIDHPVEIVLSRFAQTVRAFDLELSQPATIRNAGLARQDRRPSAESRIANWREFRTDLKRLGLTEAAFAPIVDPEEPAA